MRRILAIALFFALALGCVSAQETIYYESTPTLMWDAVTTDADGNPFLPGDIIEYEVYLWDYSQGDPTVQPVTSLTYFGTVGVTEIGLTFPYRADWTVAVRTKHTDGGGNITYSGLAYSTVLEDTATGPFVYVPTLQWVPMDPTGLRDSGM